MADRLTDVMLSGAFANQQSAPMANPAFGGMDGYYPDLRFVNAHTPYSQRQLICRLVKPPIGFKYMPEPEVATSILKALVENQSKTITGLNRGLTVQFNSDTVGGAGEVQESVSRVERAPSKPTHTVKEKYGRPFQNFAEYCITYLAADPDSQIAMINTVANAGGRPNMDMLSDVTGFTCLYYEPDPTNRFVLKAWLVTNMQFPGTNDIVGKRDLSSPWEELELSFEFTGVSSSSLGVRMLAQRLHNQINFTNANPSFAPAFMSDIDPDVEAATINGLKTGFVPGVDYLTQNVIARS